MQNSKPSEIGKNVSQTPQLAASPNRTQLLARVAPIDMSLPGDESESHAAALLRKAKWRKVRLLASRTFAIALVLAITLSGLLFSQSYLRLHKVFRGSAATAAALKISPKSNLLKGQNSGRVNILLLGRDGGNHKNPDLTDTMMLVSIDTVNNSATLISLPTDLWVNVPGAGVMKLNAAWESGEFKYLGKNMPGSTDPNAIAAGYSMVDQTVNQILGISIDYNSVVNFQGLEQAVNTVGGISVNVPTAVNDPTMAWQNGGNALIANSGTQTFNGKEALNYSMSKETSSELARAQRQRQVLVALINKVMSLDTLGNPIKLSSLTETLGDNMATDMSLSNAGKLYSILKNVAGNIDSLDLSSLISTGNMNGQSISLPNSGLFNYSQIQQFVSLQLKNPYLIKENAKILILNGTTVAGLATNLANQLKPYGYNVVGEANTPSSGWAKTSLYDLTRANPHTKSLLEKALHLKVSNKSLNKSIPTDGADFVIIIGNNEATSNQNQAG